MPELPEIVRSRLGQMTPSKPADHPDANLLAAFAEHTLLERERATVVAHLAECADCRESLALACAAREPEVAAVAGHAFASSTRHWFQAWRWVAPAAVACCIVAVALQYHVWPVSEKNKELAAAIVSSKTAAPPRENLKMKLAPKSALARRLKAENHSIKLAEQLVPAKQVDPIRQDGLSERQPDTYAAAKDAAAAASTPVKENPPSTTIGAGREDSAVKLVPQPAMEASALRNEYAEAVPAPATSATAGPTAGALLARPRTAGSAKAGQVVEQSRMMAAQAPIASAAALEKFPLPPRVVWSINASPDTSGNSFGVVERSSDRGKTWEVVPLSNRVSFRAVAAAGPHVWAGGSDGALFHSSDGGFHWAQIPVADEYGKLTGTIVSIDAGNLSRIEITTSSGEAWISSDNGRRWKRK